MDMTDAFREVGTYRGAAAMCGCDPKTIKRALARLEAGETGRRRARSRPATTTWSSTSSPPGWPRRAGRISAKRLLPEARAAGYAGSARNFRRLVAKAKADWRRDHHRGRRPAVWSPGDTLVIDWGAEGTLHVFCAVLAWSRWRFVRFAADERAETTLAMLAECFEALGGVPKVVLADRMGCLKGGVVANVVVPTPDYVRFATHYRFRPDFCEGGDPASKGIVENLVGYAKSDLMVAGRARRRSSRRGEHRRPGVVRRGQRPGPLGDLRGPGRAARHRGRAARAAAVAAAPDRAGHAAQGRQAVAACGSARPATRCRSA